MLMIKKMTKIYFRKTGSEDSNCYIDYTPEEAQKIVKEALNEHRIVVNVYTRTRILSVEPLGPDDVLRVFPIVGGG